MTDATLQLIISTSGPIVLAVIGYLGLRQSQRNNAQNAKISTAVGADEGQPTVLNTALETKKQGNGHTTALTELVDATRKDMVDVAKAALTVKAGGGKGDRATDAKE